MGGKKSITYPSPWAVKKSITYPSSWAIQIDYLSTLGPYIYLPDHTSGVVSKQLGVLRPVNQYGYIRARSGLVISSLLGFINMLLELPEIWCCDQLAAWLY